MRFRDPKTGKVYQTVGDALVSYMCPSTCADCPLTPHRKGKNCVTWVGENPFEAAALMGYEVVEDDVVEGMCCDCARGGPCCSPDENTDCADRKEDGSCWIPYTKKEANMDKPRICEVLGVEVNEKVYYKDPNGETLQFFIKKDGNPVWVLESGELINQIGLGYAIAQAINHPDRIIRKPRFTEQDVQDAKTICRMWPRATIKFARRSNGDCFITRTQNGLHANLDLGKVDLFPTIQPGQVCVINEIDGGAE